MMTSFIEKIARPYFMRFWISGIIFAISLILANFGLFTDVAPFGVVDHQVAGTAIRIDAIQESWKAANRLGFAKFLMVADFFFIATYFTGALLGGILMRADENVRIRQLGFMVILGALLFFVFDYLETIPEAIQLFNMQGDDSLAALSSSAFLPKIFGMVLTLVGLTIKLKTDKQRKEI